MVKIRLRSSASTVKFCRTGASRWSVPVEARIERTHEIIQAVDGWKCASRFERTAFCKRERPCNKGTIRGGQYGSASSSEGWDKDSDPVFRPSE